MNLSYLKIEAKHVWVACDRMVEMRISMYEVHSSTFR